MYYFGKDFADETEIQLLLEDFLKKKQNKKDIKLHEMQKEKELQNAIN